MQQPSASCPARLCPDPQEIVPPGPQVSLAKGHVTGGDGHVGNAQGARGTPSDSLPSACLAYSLLHRSRSHTGSATQFLLACVSKKQKGNDFCLTKMEMRFFVIPLSFQNLPCIVAMAPHEMGSQVGVEVRNEPLMSNIYLLGKRLGVTLSQDNKIWMTWKQRHILHSWGIWSLR